MQPDSPYGPSSDDDALDANDALNESDDEVISEAAYRSLSRRSALTGLVGAAAGFVGWRWVQGQQEVDRIPKVLRTGHELNEALWGGLHRDGALAPTFDRSESSMLRVNGRVGVREDVDLAAWGLTVLGPDGAVIANHTMDDIRALPKVEMTVEHKCVEGWSHVVTWGGTRFSDFAALHLDAIGGSMTDYVSLETPDAEYYVGLERASMVHPQTMLTYELQGEPLSSEHGAPLRLTTPLKYGTKQLKRVGTLAFTNERPADYWTERGYDWYAHL